jgi:threonine dehydrogenase-like Zn-dependent dehydrogenase
MRAITVTPGEKGSARLTDMPEPEGPGLPVEGLALGICGTDHEIVEGGHCEAPPGEQCLVLGHESLGRLADTGDLVVGIVRRPDPEPCRPCAAGEWDFCENGRYTERGIKGLHGYGAERWRIEADFMVRVPDELGSVAVLTEPASVLAKAWEQIERIAARSPVQAERALITGAGPIGLLAAMMAVQRGLDTHVLDRATEGLKPDLVRALGATYHSGSVEEARGDRCDVIVECTGAPQVVLDVMEHNAANGIVCLTGVSLGGTELTVDAGGLNRRLVLENDVVFGTVNANRRHYEQALASLAAAERGWLERMISRRVPLSRFEEALERRDDDVKVVIDLQA